MKKVSIFHFPDLYYINLVQPGENVESLIFLGAFLNFVPMDFDITPVILLSLWSSIKFCQVLGNIAILMKGLGLLVRIQNVFASK